MKEKPPPLPDLDASDLPELRTLPWKDLKKVPHVSGYWRCCVVGCSHYKVVRDFGIFPVVWAFDAWVNVYENMLWCAEHWRQRANYLAAPTEKAPFEIKPETLLYSEIQSMFPHRYWKIQTQIEQYEKEKGYTGRTQRRRNDLLL